MQCMISPTDLSTPGLPGFLQWSIQRNSLTQNLLWKHWHSKVGARESRAASILVIEFSHFWGGEKNALIQSIKRTMQKVFLRVVNAMEFKALCSKRTWLSLCQRRVYESVRFFYLFIYFYSCKHGVHDKDDQIKSRQKTHMLDLWG